MSVSSNDRGSRAEGRADAAHQPGPHSPSDSSRHATPVTRQGLKSAAVLLVAFYLGLTAIWVGLGFLVTGPLADSWVGTVDHDVATWFVAQRTPALNGWSQIGSMLGETLVKVIVVAVVAVIMRMAWRSWREPFLICFTVMLEAAVFITVTWIVDRPRPRVVALDAVSVSSSFPSGHTTAAAAYGAIAIVIFERTRNLWIRALTVLVAVAVPLFVGVARMYRGVHYLTDVIAGIVLGFACVIAVYVVARRLFDSRELERRPPGRAT